MSEESSKWGPWLPENLSNKKVQSAQPYWFQPANRGASSYADWACEVIDSQPECQASSSTREHASAGGAHAWDQTWKKYSSGWDRLKWSTLTAKNLGRSDHATDREWHASTMRYSEGWAHDVP